MTLEDIYVEKDYEYFYQQYQLTIDYYSENPEEYFEDKLDR